MYIPGAHVPLLSSHPVGWAILGVAGYLTYKAGKKAGLRGEEGIEKECLTDRAVKNAMKTVCKAKMKIDRSLAGSKEKYSEMWNEARSEAEQKA